MEFEKVEENDFIKRKKYYFCPENTCTFKSIRLSKMNEHFRIHTGNKPFSFKICEYQREKCRENTKRIQKCNHLFKQFQGALHYRTTIRNVLAI